jgi:hypothetical protein
MNFNKINSPIFVIGMPRSGTTIISEAITAHEDVGWFSNYMNKIPSVTEVSLFARIIDIPKIGWYLRGKKPQDKEVYGFIRSLLPYSVEAFPVWERYCGARFPWDYLINETATKNEKQDIIKVIKKVLRFQGKSRFCTKITGPSRILYLKSIFPDAHFVHVLRDPRATIASLLHVPFWKNGGGYEKPWWQNGLCDEFKKEWEHHHKSPVALAAVQWKQVVEYAWQESMILEKGKYSEIRYEEFVNDPLKVINDALLSLNLSFSKNVRRFIRSIAKVQRNMNIKYKRYFKIEDIQLIDDITRRTARKAGYMV